MTAHIYKCVSCNAYTMENKCPRCDSEAVLPRPPKFSLEDKYADLKRKVKREELAKKGLY